jgi:glycogen debranching enzyme
MDDEWLETDGQGGFASGTAGTIRDRRYHGLLLTCRTPPTGRVMLVNGIDAWIEQASGKTPIAGQRYLPDVVYPDLSGILVSFVPEPWPCWVFRLADGAAVRQEVFLDPVSGGTILRWRGVPEGAVLHVRPLLSVRDYHALSHENGGFDFGFAAVGGNVAWRPYAGQPAVSALTNGAYRHDPCWYRQFLYLRERDRGLDCVEDLASPGVFSWSGVAGDAVMVLRAGDGLAVRAGPAVAYPVDRGGGRTIVAGYPWFTDWGRDTFISLRGLLLGTGRVAEAEAVLLGWAEHVSEGMLPNRFGDGDAAEYNTADASLWFVVAVHDLLQCPEVGVATRDRLRSAVEAILAGHVKGTRFGIGMDADGLLRAGVPGQQLTWMDAKVGDWVVTPRIGKPVEIQALWFNALRIASGWNPDWVGVADRVRDSFLRRFPDPSSGGLVDVVDAGHQAGAVDASVRPNQIFAVGGLPFVLLEGKAARGVVSLVEEKLLTPLGLRTLSPEDPAYQPRYGGGPLERDGAYHQGTVWPWLMGPFVEAWLRVHGDADAAHTRFLAPLMVHLDTAGLGHVSEVADGDAPHTPGGCPFQAWSMGELIRVRAMVQEKRVIL